ncbi:MAG: DUF2283 domain-containing protein [Dehalococcoidia bacterium]|jgi:uncharacterized protein YuzE
MKLNYHPDTDSLYIHLSPRPGADAQEIADDFVVDFDAEGNVVGIEVQHASERIDLTRIETSGLPTPARAG